MDREVEENLSADHPVSFAPHDIYSLDHHQQQHHDYGQQIMRPPEGSEGNLEMVDYMLSNPPPQPQISLDKLSFADVMHFADFGPKLGLNQSRSSEDESYFARFQEESLMPPPPLLLPSPTVAGREGRFRGGPSSEGEREDGGLHEEGDEEEALFSENASSVQQLGFVDGVQKTGIVEGKNVRRKRPRTMKTSQEVESQRMTHIAVERNRRKQMNEHLRVLRSLMPSSYVQRGDQASIIGGAIEFVRELEQLLQCLESQKRRRMFGGGEVQRGIDDAPAPPNIEQNSAQQPFFPPLPLQDGDHLRLQDFDPSAGLREEIAESKSCLADIEVRMLGFDAMIKILSRRRPGQLLKTIAALEDMQLSILHTNITTIEQTVLYSFNVKIVGETRYSAEEIASSVQQILGFIDASAL